MEMLWKQITDVPYHMASHSPLQQLAVQAVCSRLRRSACIVSSAWPHGHLLQLGDGDAQVKSFFSRSQQKGCFSDHGPRS